jgi:hypothetical protein
MGGPIGKALGLAGRGQSFRIRVQSPNSVGHDFRPAQAFSFSFSNPLRNTSILAILAHRRPYKTRDFANAGHPHTVEESRSTPAPPDN